MSADCSNEAPEETGWPARIEGSQHPVMRAVARLADMGGVRTSTLARVVGRGNKDLIESFFAKNPKPATILDTAAAVIGLLFCDGRRVRLENFLSAYPRDDARPLTRVECAISIFEIRRKICERTDEIRALLDVQRETMLQGASLSAVEKLALYDDPEKAVAALRRVADIQERFLRAIRTAVSSALAELGTAFAYDDDEAA